MNNGNGGTVKNGHIIIAAIISVIGAVGGAGGGSYIYFSRLAPAQLEAMARHDPFRGEDGKELDRRITAIEKRVSNLPPRELIVELALLRQEVVFLHQSLSKLENHEHPK